MTVFLMQMKDTCAEGDGERNDLNMKRLLLYFKSHSSFSKYAIEMFTAIAQRKALLSEEMAHRIRWGRFVNWVGGKGKNIECDTAQEICNRVCKNIVLGMGANKTSAAIVRASKSAAGVEQILTQFDSETGVCKKSSAHTSRSSHADEDIMIKDLKSFQPLSILPGRCHEHFKDIKSSPLEGMNMEKFCNWLDEHKKNLAMDNKKA